MEERIILHLDMDAFFAAVEARVSGRNNATFELTVFV